MKIFELKHEAIQLRVEKGLPLKEISRILKISKSTASLWLRDFPLSEVRKEELRAFRPHKGRKKYVPKEGESKFYKTFPEIKLTSNQKAKLAEAAVLFRLVLNGFEPMSPVFDGDKTDWAVRRPDGKLRTIQVKWASSEKGGSPTISIRHSAGPKKRGKLSTYKEGDFDFLVGYDYRTDTCYIYSWDEVKGLKRSVSISENAVERWDKIMGDVDQLAGREIVALQVAGSIPAVPPI